MPDPFALLEEAARRQGREQECLKKIDTARRQLIFAQKPDHCFWATLALRLKVEIDWDLPTGATDGTNLYVNPDFACGLKDAEVIGFTAHEVAHCAQRHMSRLGDRELSKANIAMDLAINPLLTQAGFQLPKGALFPGQPSFRKIPPDLSFEAIYALLPDEQGEESGAGQENVESDGAGDRCPDPGACGGVMQAGDEAACREQEAQWQENVAQAAQVAKGRGELSAGLSRWIDGILKPITDPWDVIRDFLQRHVRTDISWCPPNRRFVWQGLYLPGPKTEVTGDIVIFVDQSGSISGKDSAVFAAGIEGIVSVFPGVRLTIAYHDTKICGTQTWEPSDGPLVLSPSGGGGTSHVCCWDHLRKLEEEPSCVVALTDCDTDFGKAPNVPVLWAVVNNPSVKPPFGLVAHLDGQS